MSLMILLSNKIQNVEKKSMHMDRVRMIFPSLMLVLVISMVVVGCSNDATDQDLDPSGSATLSGTPIQFVPQEIIFPKDGAKMVLVPGEEFKMGDHFNDGLKDEVPMHTVYVDAFYMDAYEVTNQQYQKFIDATGYQPPKQLEDPKFNSPNQPVIGVDWFDAVGYAKWAGKRLPTEAEWEKAARGSFIGKRYPWGNYITHNDANYNGSNGRDQWVWKPASVGSFPPNRYGLYDMAGNVSEWCWDWYDSNYYSLSAKKNPKGPIQGAYRIVRGGSWNSNKYYLRVATRNFNSPESYYQYCGFRCVCDATTIF